MALKNTVCFHVVEESVIRDLPNMSDLHSWESLNDKIQPITWGSKIRLCDKSTKIELDDVTRDTEEWITVLELLRGNLRKLGDIIDYVENLDHIPSNLPKEYNNIIKKLEYELYYDIDMLAIKRIWDKLSSNYDIMNEISNQNEPK